MLYNRGKKALNTNIPVCIISVSSYETLRESINLFWLLCSHFTENLSVLKKCMYVDTLTNLFLSHQSLKAYFLHGLLLN